MRMHPNDFPAHRQQDPTRRAELDVYDQLAGSELPGYVVHEAQPFLTTPEIDFAIRFEGRARIALQVKSGEYTVNDQGEWRLRTGGGAGILR